MGQRQAFHAYASGGNQCQWERGAQTDMAAAAHQPREHPPDHHAAHHPGISHHKAPLRHLYQDRLLFNVVLLAPKGFKL